MPKKYKPITISKERYYESRRPFTSTQLKSFKPIQAGDKVLFDLTPPPQFYGGLKRHFYFKTKEKADDHVKVLTNSYIKSGIQEGTFTVKAIKKPNWEMWGVYHSGELIALIGTKIGTIRKKYLGTKIGSSLIENKNFNAQTEIIIKEIDEIKQSEKALLQKYSQFIRSFNAHIINLQQLEDKANKLNSIAKTPSAKSSANDMIVFVYEEILTQKRLWNKEFDKLNF